MQCLLGWSAHRALRRRGVPTILQIDLPFGLASDSTRRHFARTLLQEWTRVEVDKPDWTPALDFTICLRHDLPAEFVTGHYHPAKLKDPFHGQMLVKSASTRCPACA